MFERFKNGWRLLLCSLDVMRRNKGLLLFPAATAVLTLALALLFLTPIALQPTGHSYKDGAHWQTLGSRLFVEEPAAGLDAAGGRKTTVRATPMALAYFALFYLLSMFLATFFNVAFVHEIFDALAGRPVSVAGGLSFAATRLKPILLWTLFAGLVGFLIKSLEEKFGLFGRWVVRLIGLAWSVASVFVIPVLVLEESPDNPLDVLRRSAAVIKKTWGEALGGYAGLQIAGTLTLLSGLIFLPASFAIGLWLGQYGLMAAGIAFWFAFLVAFSYVSSVASQIYLCVLYQYASTGVVPAGYSSEMLSLAWKPKQ